MAAISRSSTSKGTSSQCFLLSLGIKRIGCCSNEGENSSEGQPESEPPDDEDDPDLDNTDSTDELMECSIDCCRPDCDGPNQVTSSHVLAATKRLRSHQARYVQVGWFSQHPWLFLCETRKKLFCCYCSVAESRKLITFSNKAEDTFQSVVSVTDRTCHSDSLSMKVATLIKKLT